MSFQFVTCKSCGSGMGYIIDNEVWLCDKDYVRLNRMTPTEDMRKLVKDDFCSNCNKMILYHDPENKNHPNDKIIYMFHASGTCKNNVNVLGDRYGKKEENRTSWKDKCY